jgi:hypothetical protein
MRFISVLCIIFAFFGVSIVKADKLLVTGHLEQPNGASITLNLGSKKKAKKSTNFKPIDTYTITHEADVNSYWYVSYSYESYKCLSNKLNFKPLTENSYYDTANQDNFKCSSSQQTYNNIQSGGQAAALFAKVIILDRQEGDTAYNEETNKIISGNIAEIMGRTNSGLLTDEQLNKFYQQIMNESGEFMESINSLPVFKQENFIKLRNTPIYKKSLEQEKIKSQYQIKEEVITSDIQYNIINSPFRNYSQLNSFNNIKANSTYEICAVTLFNIKRCGQFKETDKEKITATALKTLCGTDLTCSITTPKIDNLLINVNQK